MERLALGAGHCSTRNGDRLASQGFGLGDTPREPRQCFVGCDPDAVVGHGKQGFQCLLISGLPVRQQFTQRSGFHQGIFCSHCVTYSLRREDKSAAYKAEYLNLVEAASYRSLSSLVNTTSVHTTSVHVLV